MNNSKYVTVKFILDKVFRDNSYDLELKYADVIEWLGEVHGLVGVPVSYKTRITNGQGDNPSPLEIVDYKALLPCDFHIGLQARLYESKTAMTYASDTYHVGYIDVNSADLTFITGITYGFDDNYIWTSFREGQVELLYKAFPVDEDGMPLIPDNGKYIEAASAYIRMKVDYILWRQGKVTDKIYSDAQTQWAWYVGAARTSMRIPNMDQMEAIKNQYLRLIPSINEHQWSYRYLGEKEQIKLHSDFNNLRY